MRGSASVVVTFNLDDFPPECLGEFGVEPLYPDECITHLIDLARLPFAWRPNATALASRIRP
jgi:hypothetical protein